VMCHSAQQAEEVKARLKGWLVPRGLSFNEDKTKIVHLEEGFSFLGCDIRRHVDRQGSVKLAITPSQESVRRLRSRLAAELRSLRGANAAAVVARLNPIVRGWAAYYRSVVCSRAFSRWTTSCGTSPGGGDATATRTSRDAGLPPGTSAGSTGPGEIGGSSVTPRRAPTSPSAPGPGTFPTPQSGAGRPRTTQPWPATGLSDVASTDPRHWTATP